jgi:hypothetical protein
MPHPRRSRFLCEVSWLQINLVSARLPGARLKEHQVCAARNTISFPRSLRRTLSPHIRSWMCDWGIEREFEGYLRAGLRTTGSAEMPVMLRRTATCSIPMAPLSHPCRSRPSLVLRFTSSALGLPFDAENPMSSYADISPMSQLQKRTTDRPKFRLIPREAYWTHPIKIVRHRWSAHGDELP